MRKILVFGALALGLALGSEQTASAWVNFKFGAGINWNYQSGGNNTLWGLFRNGQPPGPDGQQFGPGGQTFPGHPQFGPQNFQYFGNQGYNPGVGQQTVPTDVPAFPAQTPVAQAYGYGPVYQPVSYNPYYNSAYGYSAPVYQPVSYNPYAYSQPAYFYTTEPAYGSYNQPIYWGLHR